MIYLYGFPIFCINKDGLYLEQRNLLKLTPILEKENHGYIDGGLLMPHFCGRLYLQLLLTKWIIASRTI